jgi:hypothetical protein
MKFIRSLLTGVPVLTLTAGFIAICVHFGTAWPWSAAVHESGNRTLLQTIFYFEHALGELPLEWLLAAAVAGAVLRFRKPRAQAFLPLLLAAATVDALIVIGSWWNVGFEKSLEFLLQYHTRDQSPLDSGSHWRYHLLSQAALMLAPAAITGPRNPRILRSAWIVFALASLLFGLSMASFADPQYLGRQARETFTHALVTVPLAVAACLFLSSPAAEAGARISWLAAGACLLLGLYQAIGVVLTGSRQHAQTQEFVRVVWGHFFEHFLSYVVVPVHAALFYVWSAPKAKA